MECQMCKKVLAKRGSHFICQGPCGGTFHRGCVKGLTEDLKAGRNRLRCNNCESGNDTDDEEQEDEMQSFNQILKDIQKKVNSLPGLKKQLESIKESMSVLSDKYDNLLFENNQNKERIVKLEKTTVSTNNKCVYLEKCNLALEQKVNELEQSSRKNNIEIVGIEQLPEENVKSVVIKISETLNVSHGDIESARRVRPSKPDNKPAPIVVRFKTSGTEARDKWLAQRRKLAEVTSNMVTGGTQANRIFINEDLTKTARALLWNTKKQVHGIYKYVWVNNGKILVKKADGDKSIWVRSESEIADLLKVK